MPACTSAFSLSTILHYLTVALRSLSMMLGFLSLSLCWTYNEADVGHPAVHISPEHERQPLHQPIIVHCGQLVLWNMR